MLNRFVRALAKAALEVAVDELKEAHRSRRSEREGRPSDRPGRSADHDRMRSEPPPWASARRDWGAWAPPPKPREEVTAVLRRQIPPRGEPPRSWIGGLPMLPDTIEWPRARNQEYPEAGEIPLNFAAQIACADLPKDLWGGLGPRQGWLVFFVATWGCASFEDEGSIRVFHTSELGRERQPPADKRSVGDPEYSGGNNPALAYERWPVDILPFANRPEFPSGAPWTGDAPVSPIPPGFERWLYGDAPVAEWRPKEEPFTWGALATVLENTLGEQARRPWGGREREVPRLAPDGRDRALAGIAEEEAELADLQAKAGDPDQQARREHYVAERRAKLERQRAFLGEAGEPFDPESLARRIEQSQAERRAWLSQQQAVMEAMLAEAKSHGARIWLSAADRARIADRLSAAHGQWRMGTVTPRNRIPCPEYTILRLADLVERERSRSVAIAARDLYAAGPQERASLPEAMRLALEADLRRLEDNRPHRLGGIHQAVQDTIAPQGKMLLLQLGTDAATGFNWGDSGALFAWIGVDALARGDFNAIEWWTENT